MTNEANLMWSPRDPSQTNMFKFMEFVNQQHSLSLNSYEELRVWSISNISLFWACVWQFCKVKASANYLQVVDESIPINQLPKWFEGSRLNYAENMLQHNNDRIAIIGTGEDADDKLLSYKQLRAQVGQLAAALRKFGIVPGDRIAALVPNSPESIVFMLAANTVGAIWSSASPDFGAIGVLDRFSQISPRLLVSVGSVVYNQKTHDNIEKLKQIVVALPSVEKVIMLPHLSGADFSCVPNSTSLADFLDGVPEQEPVFEQLPFEHPLAILFSSGTTGVPKCIVHGQGGVLIQHMKEHLIHGNMNENDVYFYYSTTGWMMWNWLISGLISGGTIICYDGNPVKPTPARLWSMVPKYGMTIFGTSAKYIQNLEEINYFPGKEFNLSTLHSIYSTGSALKPHSFDFIYSAIKSDIMVGSITGGTDIVSLFAGHNTALPVYRGEIQCRCLGMAVEAWDDSGKSVVDEPGDLVCTKAFPVMPVAFWNDSDGQKYQNAYFNQVPGVWYHGDYMSINSETGGVLMLGRSDGTLNPAGVRFGSAELYNIMNDFPEVQDTLAVGQKTADGERVVLFLKMATGYPFSSELVTRIKTKIKTLLTARHVPAVILPIGDIPYTLTGKKVEVAVKKIISGEQVKPSSSLANPESLQLYYAIKSKL